MDASARSAYGARAPHPVGARRRPRFTAALAADYCRDRPHRRRRCARPASAITHAGPTRRRSSPAFSRSCSLLPPARQEGREGMAALRKAWDAGCIDPDWASGATPISALLHGEPRVREALPDTARRRLDADALLHPESALPVDPLPPRVRGHLLGPKSRSALMDARSTHLSGQFRLRASSRGCVVSCRSRGRAKAWDRLTK
mgnify:CR=1 FL=1